MNPKQRQWAQLSAALDQLGGSLRDAVVEPDAARARGAEFVTALHALALDVGIDPVAAVAAWIVGCVRGAASTADGPAITSRVAGLLGEFRDEHAARLETVQRESERVGHDPSN